MAERVKYATFFLSGIYFGLPAIQVQEVLECLDVVQVPLAPAALPGIINLRGQIIPVLDLGRRLDLPANQNQSREQSRMMVIRTEECPVSMLIDHVGEILDVDSTCFEKPAETLKSTIRAVTTHVCRLDERLLLILDGEKLIQFAREKETTQEKAEVDLGVSS